MNSHSSRLVKRMMRVLAFGFCLAFVAVAESGAHPIGVRPGLVAVHPGYAGTRYFPGWLRRNRDFQHWYRHSRYRLRQHHDWHRLYHLYLIDRHHYRRGRYYHRRHDDHGPGPCYGKRGYRHY